MLALVMVAGCKEAPATVATPAAKPAPPRRVALAVVAEGFVPDAVPLKAGEPVTLVVTRKTDETCATDLLIEGTEIKVALPLNAPVEVAYTPAKTGKVKFGCAMDMMVSGVLLVE
jgi:plastocyanin domain-containing protein